MNALRSYLAARMHRRVFLWIGVTLVTAAAVVVGVYHLAWPHPDAAQREVDRLRRFASGRFAQVWNDPVRRDELARATARDLEVGVRLTDLQGTPLAAFGPACRRTRFTTPVRVDGRAVGHVQVCPPRRWRPSRWGVLASLAVLVLTVWIASGLISRRLLRPLEELAQVARDIGAGKLSSRVKLGRDQAGEVGVLAVTLNDMAARIERQIADQRELLAAVSHEIRTPLGHLRILLELAADQGVDPATVADLEREVREIDGLVDQLLASSRLDFSALRPVALDARAVALDALSRASVPAERLVAPEGPLPFQADPTLVLRALANLLGNAARHGGGVTALRIEADDRTLGFVVEDQGPGFAAEARARAFEPFYQGPDGQRAGRGALGLGLALVRRIALAHGGDAFIEDQTTGAAVGLRIRTAPPGS